MEEMDPVVNEEDVGEATLNQPRWYEGHISLEDAKTFIKANITTAARSFIAIGFYLKCVRDRELFTEDGFQNVWDFAKEEYGISKSTASRYMSMNDRFSEKGNSPNIREEYRAFGKSQLQEMLYLEDDQLDQIKPGDRVEDIRSLRKPKEVPYIELPGQLEFEIDFPDILPDQPIHSTISQKQTFEMSVEDMLSGEEQDGIAISQRVEAVEDIESQERTAYVKEQYRLKESFLYPFAVWLIKNHKAWFMEDHMSRVICVDKSELQLKAYLGASQSGYRSFGFPVGDDTYYAKMYDDGIEISHFTDTGFTVIDGMSEWFYLAASVQAQWNVVALEEAQAGREKEVQIKGFNSDPTSCSYRKEYSCTIPAENRTVPGDGYNCGSSCCWSCKFHGACKLECNASAGRDGALPEYDAAWFVKEWAEKVPEELERALKACRENSNNVDRAKAVQKEISPYGAHSRSCWEYNFSFHGFAGGMDFRIGKVEMNLKYGRFVQELANLYPNFEEPETVIQEPESVQEQSESVQEAPETIIDGEFVEVLPEKELSARIILEEEKAELHNWIEAFKGEGKELPPAVERRRIIVAALAAMVCELEAVEPELVKPEQPELPILKNNEQRAAFIDAYDTWPIWIETKETGERYYRYDLTDKVSMVIKVNWKHSWASYKESKDYEYGAEQYYLLGVKSEWRNGKSAYVEDDTRTFYESNTNRSALVEYLKEFQKKKEG